MPFNEPKFKTLVHYICHRCVDPRSLGKTRLNKILWYADMRQFERTGLPLTGETYVKHQFGPVPRHIDDVISDLATEGKLTVRLPEVMYDTTMFFSSEQPDLASFSADEISHVDVLIERICRSSAASVSRGTHNAIYHLAQMGEEIPYEAFLASHLGEIDESDLRWARQALTANAAS